MGVLRCSRGDCENAMCNRLSQTYGYICDECFEELVRFILQGNHDIQEFMDSPKQSKALLVEDVIRDLLDDEFEVL